MRYLIHFSYDGSNFNGYQKQPGLRTVEDELEKALFNINNHKKTKVTSSGRTDAGVHAIDQIAHFDLDIKITLYKLKCALNSLLPEDIHVFSTEIVNNKFHSRYMSVEKTYKYLVNCGEYNPILRKYNYQLNKKLDIAKMDKAIKDFIGTHNFKSFVSAECVKDNYVRTIFNAEIDYLQDIITFTFSGNGFMKYQVRNMVGTLIKIGSGKLEIDCINKLLNKSCDGKECMIFTAPAEGLYLVNVKYNENDKNVDTKMIDNGE